MIQHYVTKVERVEVMQWRENEMLLKELMDFIGQKSGRSFGRQDGVAYIREGFTGNRVCDGEYVVKFSNGGYKIMHEAELKEIYEPVLTQEEMETIRETGVIELEVVE